MTTKYRSASAKPGSSVPGQHGFTYNQDGHPVDRWGRYGIALPDDDKLIGRSRVTTYIGSLTNSYTLDEWKANYLAYGLATAEDGWQPVVKELFERVEKGSDGERRDAKNQLREIREYAARKAGREDKADWGTVMHVYTEFVDQDADGLKESLLPDMKKGRVPGGIAELLTPNQLAVARENVDLMLRDLKAYAGLVDRLGLVATHIEPRTVCDELMLTGTPDRIWSNIEGDMWIGDLKTGSIDFDPLKFSAQMAVYSQSSLYNLDTGERSSYDNLSTTEGLLIHVPAAQGKAKAVKVDLRPGWAHCAEDIPQVKARRKTKVFSDWK